MNKKVIFGVIAVAVIALLGWYFFANKSAENKTQETVKIGAILPLTGKVADAGNAVKVGLNIAIEELNVKYDKKRYEVVFFDTESDVKNVPLGYKRLWQIDKANIFFTTASDNSLLLKSLTLNDSVLLFCIAPHPDITKENHNLVFRPAPDGDGESNAIINYVENTLNASNIFVYSFNTDAGNAFKSMIENKFKEKITGSCLFDDDASLVRNITSDKNINKTECVVIYGFSAMIGNIVKSLRERGYTGNIICNSGFNTPSVLSVAGNNANNVYYVDYNFPYTSTGHLKRDSIAKEDYKTSFSALSYMAYCPIYMLDEAINNNNVSDKEIGVYLSKEKEYNINGALFETHSNGAIKPSFVIKKYIIK
jgi:branched-chain amino acid transport system substrate-binding protein